MRLILLILLVGFTVISCKKKESTVWNSGFKIPVLNDTLRINSLVEDGALSVNADHSLQLIYSRDILDFSIAELIEIPDTTIQQKVTIPFNNLTVVPGANFVNEIEEHDFDLEDVLLTEAHASQGTAKIVVFSPVNTPTEFQLKLPGVTKNGVTLVENVSVPAGTNQNPSQRELTIDLADYNLNLRGQNNDSYNILQSQLIVNTDVNGNSVDITNSDTIRFQVTLQGLKIDYGKGYFGNMVFSDTTELKIDFLQNIASGSMQFGDANIDLKVSNGIKVYGRYNLSMLSSENSYGNVVSLTHNQINVNNNLNPATGNWQSNSPYEETINFNTGNSNIQDFLENLGFKYNLGYEVEINPWGNTTGGTDEFFGDSKLKVTLEANMPLEIGADQFVIQDTFDIDLNQDDTKTHISSGKLVMNAQNSFPMEGKFTVYLLDENNNVLASLPGVGQISSGIAPLTTGDSPELVASTTEFIVSSNDVEAVNNATKMIVSAWFDTNSSGLPVPIYENSMLIMNMNSELVIENIIQ